ncbi:MAG: hypothetical protein MI919_04385, partial [Holophagales bacterium]|nr:hypothetical protein [Holophagales bacterium]
MSGRRDPGPWPGSWTSGALLSLALAIAAQSPALPAETTGRGMPLAEALEALRAEGIETIYTSRLVTAEARVEELPSPGSAEGRLRNLLAPFGLIARPLSDGRWSVVVAPPATVEGCLVSDPGGQPIAGASVAVDGSDTP